MLRRRKFLIGGLIIWLAVAYLGYMAFQGSATFYLTVAELKQQGESIYGEDVRVNGQVVPGSMEWDSKSRILKFMIAEGEQSLPVDYSGTIPDAFKAGSDVVIEGKLDSGGIFQAHTILTKCPSRYVPEE